MSTDVTRLLTDTGGLALWCLLLGVCLHRDNRQLRNGFLALLVALWSIRLVSRLAEIAVTGKLRVPDDCSAEGAGEISVEVVGGVASANQTRPTLYRRL